MTRRTDAPRNGDVLACWCALAERRLDYLTEMFESGRWRRYFTELSFLENIREARNAVETWRNLSALSLRRAEIEAPAAVERRTPLLRNTW
jgi:uncharacterized repeat protein (TIGR03809 family)